MKKAHLILLPIMTMSFLVGCNNNGGGGDDPEPPIVHNHWYEYTDWWNYCSDGNVGEATKEDIGRVVNLNVNNQFHKVRLIDVDKDVDSDDKTIHTTFEFVNLLSDDDGYSLATQWNDTNDTATSNYDYRESSIRKALNGGAEEKILWAQKGEDHWSTEYTGSVLEMLDKDNPGLVDAIKAASKIVNVNEDSKWIEETFSDKLFLLSPAEMGYLNRKFQEQNTTTYSYYEGAVDATRIKMQIKGNKEAPSKSTQITAEKGQTFSGTVFNCAGNNSQAEGCGGITLLRSPYTESGKEACDTNEKGQCSRVSYVYNNAYGFAPAFCI